VRRRLVPILVLVILLLAGYSLTRLLGQRKTAAEEAAREEVAVAVETQPVASGVIERSFALTGTIEAEVDIGVVPKIPGKVTKVYVREGQAVRAGQLLVELERKDLVAQRHQAQAAVQAARARVQQAETGVELQEAETSTSITSAEAQLGASQSRLRQAETTAELTSTQTTTSLTQAEEVLKQAQARLDMLRTGARRQEKQQAEEAVHQAQANLDTAKKNLDRARQLLEQGAIAQQQFDAAKLQYAVALAQYNTAVQQRDLVQEGARSEEIRIAEAQVQQAVAALTLARANEAQRQISQREVEAAQERVRQAQAGLAMAQAAIGRNLISEEEVKAASAALAQATANVNYLEAQISYTYVRAPASGRIAERKVEPGGAASPATPMFRLVDNSRVYVRATVSEVNVREVYREQKVGVTIDALGGAEFIGTIAEILPIADPSSRAFEVKIHLPDPEGRLKQGMFARVKVVAERQTGLIVPREAVIERAGKHLVYVAQAGRALEREVQTGLHDPTQIIVLSGLRPDEQVVVRGQGQLKPNQKLRIQNQQEPVNS